MNTNIVTEARERMGSPKSFRAARDNALDLAFDGWKIAEGRCGDRQYECDWTRWTVVTLYVTEKGKFVVTTSKHSRWQGDRDMYDASLHDSFGRMVTALIEENGHRLGPASKAMIEEAVSRLPALEGADVVHV